MESRINYFKILLAEERGNVQEENSTDDRRDGILQLQRNEIQTNVVTRKELKEANAIVNHGHHQKDKRASSI